ncbi:hypothetical protein COT66_00645 [Candidatus Shapirobacteria bacterium CG09_land_8_20_14_0_10_49_15]|uniref:Uncharacterized protein n=2 Tax=Candidatus Shapironibacteriota TaxID=1752721 RepID=A0A2M8L751_9BACT|nr:MAG: hypothetical protein COT66_00645 [Candidatus Shapirobacteria bacterium CG09_land_8_20_14_0_10_49_15]PJE70073.1 MAG: hypothetical protein COU97_01620 [Candidatus Shapirobacteria bacterium CG10_big_fil_rev_8_21_14_0_10_48_15]
MGEFAGGEPGLFAPLSFALLACFQLWMAWQTDFLASKQRTPFCSWKRHLPFSMPRYLHLLKQLGPSPPGQKKK